MISWIDWLPPRPADKTGNGPPPNTVAERRLIEQIWDAIESGAKQTWPIPPRKDEE